MNRANDHSNIAFNVRFVVKGVTAAAICDGRVWCGPSSLHCMLVCVDSDGGPVVNLVADDASGATGQDVQERLGFVII